jgi:flagellar biosynthetic protein FliQ
MQLDELIRLLQQSLLVVLMVSAPVMVAAVAVSVVVGVVQSATQLHDAVLSWVPKLVAGVLVLWATSAWAGESVLRLAAEAWRTLLMGSYGG